MNNKVAIITGGSRGIGAEIAKTLASDAISVLINYHTQKDEAEKIQEQIIHEGGEASIIQADVNNRKDVERLFEFALTSYGRIDYLIQNAGMARYNFLRDCSDEDFEEIYNLNVKGVFYGLQLAATHMREKGRIINISSTTTKMTLARYGLYSSSKAAVEQMTKVFSKEVGDKRITVNCISPGPVDTELFRRGKTEETIAQMATLSPFNRIGEVDDIAKVVRFLVSDAAAWITGQNIMVNGGIA